MLPSYLQRNISTTFNSNFLILWTLHSKYQYWRVKSVVLRFISWKHPHYFQLSCENSCVSRTVGWSWQWAVNSKKAQSDNFKWWNINTSTIHRTEIRTRQWSLNFNTHLKLQSKYMKMSKIFFRDSSSVGFFLFTQLQIITSINYT